MKIKLAQIEARLQALIEGGAARLFPSAQKENDLTSRLLEALRNGIQTGRDGEAQAPNLYTLTVHPVQAQVFYSNPLLIEGLTQTLHAAGAEAGVQFSSPPVIRVAEDAGLSQGEIQVTAKHSRENLPQTSDMDREFEGKNGDAIPPNAFLIVDGMHIFSLDQAVLNIGRRQDNQLVVNDARVSRVHAQLRAVKGQYVIFDLDSTGGTYVNGERIHQCKLYPGDVISLSGVPLVFGQDPYAQGETQNILPSSPDEDGSWS